MSATEVAIPQRARSADLSALGALFGLTVRQHTHGRRLWVLAALYAIPCALAILLRYLGAPGEAVEFALVLTLLPHGLAPLTALLYAAGVVADEVEEQTLTYLLLRSVPRWQLYLTKLLATFCVTAALASAGVAALYLAIYAGTPGFVGEVLPRMGTVIGVTVLAQVGYCALFGLLGLVTRRSLIAGVAYIVAFEGVLANINFVGRSLTLVYYVRTLVLRWLELPADLSRQCQANWGMAELEKLPSAGACVLTVAGFGLAVSVVAALWFARSEFRVKTPGSD